jgi:Tol biopolymer transport system component
VAISQSTGTEARAREEAMTAVTTSGGGKWQVSTGGATDPVWAPDGKRLYFVDSAENVLS